MILDDNLFQSTYYTLNRNRFCMYHAWNVLCLERTMLALLKPPKAIDIIYSFATRGF